MLHNIFLYIGAIPVLTESTQRTGGSLTRKKYTTNVYEHSHTQEIPETVYVSKHK